MLVVREELDVADVDLDVAVLVEVDVGLEEVLVDVEEVVEVDVVLEDVVLDEDVLEDCTGAAKAGPVGFRVHDESYWHGIMHCQMHISVDSTPQETHDSRSRKQCLPN